MITAWGTIPEYLTLGFKSPSEQPGLDSTSVGITVRRTLQSVVRAKEQDLVQFEVLAVELGPWGRFVGVRVWETVGGTDETS